MAEVAREHAVVLDDRLGRLALGRQDLAHEELGAGCDVAFAVARDHAAQQRERGIVGAGEEQRARATQLGLGTDRGIAHQARDARVLRRRAVVVAGCEERVGLAEQRSVVEGRAGVAVGHLLERCGGAQQRARFTLAQRVEIGGGRARMDGAERAQRIGRLLVEGELRGPRQRDARVRARPRRAGGESRERLSRIFEISAAHRVPGAREPRLVEQRAMRPVLLPLRPLARRLCVLSLRLDAPDRREGGVVREGALLGALHRLAVRVLSACEVGARIAHRSRERERGRALRGARSLHDLRQRAVEVVERRQARGAAQELRRFERPRSLAQRRDGGSGRRARGCLPRRSRRRRDRRHHGQQQHRQNPARDPALRAHDASLHRANHDPDAGGRDRRRCGRRFALPAGIENRRTTGSSEPGRSPAGRPSRSPPCACSRSASAHPCP